jgi:hypothetical protein
MGSKTFFQVSRGLMPAMVSGFNGSHALPFNIDKRTRGGRQELRASDGCVPGRRIPAQQAGELRDGEHRAGPAVGVRRQRGTGSLPGAEKHWFARCEARLTLQGVDRLDSRVPVFVHEERDLATFRMFASQVAVNGNVTQAQISRTFRVPLVTVKRYVGLYREGGVRAFFVPPKRRAGHKLTAEVCQQAQMLLDRARRFRRSGDGSGFWQTLCTGQSGTGE